ncbi:butyrophilin subfamily 1 member A1-like isoform X1 [Acipenser ruthenus]|uniref:butyrophilin subfamily 1 member A1-like isoform X1 n=1 Tax=Acipenser ruthenus TaxID=7906 RepID=UPI002741CEC2|nr:butyrophilin subfamily 1 member A1-like isoform X1 [Acipenser ruthenus]
MFYMRMKTRSQGQIFLIVLSFLPAASTNRETVIGAAQPIIAEARQQTTLPCLLTPAVSTLHLEVRWFRNSFASPVHLYKDLSDQTATQDSGYHGRTSLFESELAKGNLSLILKNLRPSDSGVYSCFASDGTWSAEAKTELVIRAVGTQPSISVDSTQGQQTRLVCRSEGWSPEPEVIWRDRDGNDVTSLSSTTVERNTQGYLRIRSYIEAETQSEGFSCLVRIKQPHPEPDTKLQLPSSFLPGISGWVVATSVIIALGIAAVPPLLIQWKVNESSLYPPESETITADTMEPTYVGKPVSKSDCKLICGPDGETPIAKSEWKRICSSAVDVTLDPNTAHPLLILSGDGKRVRWEVEQQDLPDNPERFDWWRSVLGKEGFTSGRHYWEVEVGENHRWILGVSRESIHRKGVMRWSPGEGYWAVGRDGEPFLALTDPPAPLPLRQALRKVGVYLDYDKKQLSFYNTETRSLVCTLSDNFSGKLYPVFFTLDVKTDLVIVPPVSTVQ